MIRRVVPFPFVPKPIPKGEEEEEEEDEEDNVPLNRRTWLTRAMQRERRRSSTITLPSIPEEPLETSTSKDEMK